MKKRIFGIKLGTILTAVVCLAVAFAIWMVVKYRADLNAEIEGTAISLIPYLF